MAPSNTNLRKMHKESNLKDNSFKMEQWPLRQSPPYRLVSRQGLSSSYLSHYGTTMLQYLLHYGTIPFELWHNYVTIPLAVWHNTFWIMAQQCYNVSRIVTQEYIAMQLLLPHGLIHYIGLGKGTLRKHTLYKIHSGKIHFGNRSVKAVGHFQKIYDVSWSMAAL